MVTKKLKIGLILDTSLDPNDGVQQYVVNIGKWLLSRGYEVHYLVGETTKRKLPNIHSLARNITVSFNGNRTTIPLPVSKHKLRSLIETENFDVLHVQTPHHPFMAQRLIGAAGPNVAVIGTFHVLPLGWLSRFGNRLLGLWLKPSLRRIDQMLAVSPAAAEFEQQTFGLKAEVLPNVIDYTLYRNAHAYKEYQDGRFNILFFGRLVPRKGCQILLEAIAILVHDKIQLPNLRVIICGTGPLESSIKKYANSHGLEEVVEFTGFVNEKDKPRYYASADLAVFPSRGGESFGIVLIEAMAAGNAAVIAGNNPGYRSVLGAQPESLFNPNNAQELAKKITNLLKDKEQLNKLFNWQQQTVKQYDVEVVGQKLLKIYTAAIAKRQLKRHN